MTVPGPFTLAQQTQDEHYRDERALALDFAAAVNDEVKDLFAAGADVVQLDEPYLEARPERARRVRPWRRSTGRSRAWSGTTALHVCFGYGHFIKDKPAGYACLDELRDCRGRPAIARGGAAGPRLHGCSS